MRWCSQWADPPQPPRQDKTSPTSPCWYASAASSNEYVQHRFCDTQQSGSGMVFACCPVRAKVTAHEAPPQPLLPTPQAPWVVLGRVLMLPERAEPLDARCAL